MYDVIYSYDDFVNRRTIDSLFWIIEYRDADEANRYSVFRNECLQHPADFKDRLNSGVYRIWTTTPREIPW